RPISANTTMNLQGFRDQKGTERLATPKELAEFGGVPSDPMTEAQILALIQGEMDEDLKKAAEGSAAQAKVAAMRELAAALDQEAPGQDEDAAGPNEEQPLPELRMLGARREKRGTEELSESDRVAAAFFGEEEVQAAEKTETVGEVKEKAREAEQATKVKEVKE